jgi:D-serine deaminase-like pyridoxal phosphate-dependent protein
MTSRLAHGGLEGARGLIGQRRDAPSTPAIILDLPKVKQNIEEMRRRMETVPASLRPHVKIHKSPILGQMQIDAGAIGLTTATVWEATAMVEGGIEDVLIANQTVGSIKAAELARLASRAHVSTEVDDLNNGRELSRAAAEAGSTIGVVVELDVGMHRSGVRSVEAAVALGQQLQKLPALQLRGIIGYEGHCMLEPDRSLRISKTRTANALLLSAVAAFRDAGLPTEIVGAGGLGTWDITGANPGITEIHAGSYVFMDAFHRKLVPGFESALTVLSTVISRTGSMAVLDCGRKSIGIDRALPELVGGEGAVRFEHGEHFIHEEHTAITLERNSQLAVGDRVELIPGYAPTTVNLYDLYYVAADGTIVDVWPVLGRYGCETAGAGVSESVRD